MELDSDEIQFFHELAYMGAVRGLDFAAQDIFEMLAEYRPDSIYPYLGLGFNIVNNGDARKGIEILETKVLKRSPDNNQAKLYIALGYQKLKQYGKADNIIREVENNNPNADEKMLLTSLKAQNS